MEEGDSKSTLTFRDCQMKAELESKVYDQDGVTVNLGGRGQATQSRDLWEAAGTLSVAANNLGGAKLNMEVSDLDNPTMLFNIKTVLLKLVLEIRSNFRVLI